MNKEDFSLYTLLFNDMARKQNLVYALMALSIASFLSITLLHTYPQITNEGVYLFMQDFLIFIISLIAFIMGFILVRRKYDFCGAWKYLTFGLGLWVIGEFIWMLYENVFGILDPYPSIADIFWVLGYLPFVTALIMHIKAINAKVILQNFFTSVTGAFASAAALVYVFNMHIFPPGTNFFEGILALAYPLADLILIVLSVFLIVHMLRHKDTEKCGNTNFTSWAFLAAGFLILAAADVLMDYSFVSDISLAGNFANVIYVASYLLITISAFVAITSKSVVISYPHHKAKLRAHAH